MLDSGVLSLRNCRICHEWTNGAWDVPVDQVRVIGEATTDIGPFADDYWLYFATRADLWYEASFYAAGRDVFLKALSEQLGDKLVLGLCNSTNFASRVLWPPHLVGKPMFVYTPKWPPNRFSRAAVKLLGGPFQNLQTLSDEVKQFLEEAA
jgi:hypothetical protein